MGRNSAGRRSVIDKAVLPPELQEAKRTLMVGTGDPALASYPLGVMLARRMISADQHNAGVYFGYLYGRVIDRRTTAKAVNLDTSKGIFRTAESAGEVFRQKLCWHMIEVTQPWPVVKRTCCYYEFPQFFYRTVWRLEDLDDIRALQSALLDLHKTINGQVRRAYAEDRE